MVKKHEVDGKRQGLLENLIDDVRIYNRAVRP
jgi:hypothetical protein